jgi:hypothetical protein
MYQHYPRLMPETYHQGATNCAFNRELLSTWFGGCGQVVRLMN